MINRIGYAGDADKDMSPLVLMNLDEADRETLARLLLIAEAHLAEIPYPELRSRRRLAEEMIYRLRTQADLPMPAKLRGTGTPT